ncbi:hypothetical protein A2627_05415 [Candidatus Woesebacteria bacterium RIFCSPHIGHO2_01_FULL_39_28]|uniref:Sortase n=1 Tax=Candidatus Woesebacteria bacterium RIFCSPHIGHO2_01_FULL_39_28 TaxID=1802496 RepID=A0A1F7YHR0_9BACT|nr:MAG: hypothetical protein A2627_05415 [Candidatus Woesebacteria bacterium RIFCSPHIGHO2_01_FULL_39_28]OGM58216.1 MAG: hypothetical protein A3A50_04370 [Candidatus Woesebacteria bacterium RIFCSPLOWO2_01_FULL_38_20]
MYKRILASGLAIVGIIILSFVFYPILSYGVDSNQYIDSYLSPIPNDELNLNQQTDLTKASNWFTGGASKEDFVSSNVSYYTISIPKLGIENAVVSIGGEDLSKNLVQYPGTALPGKRGNSVIFGHSILPLFFNPKNYMSIFSTLPVLKKGDSISLYYDGVYYEYRVENMIEVYPTDLEVLEQNTNDSFLTLVTCVPPGDPRKPKRLLVRARILPPREAVNADIRY